MFVATVVQAATTTGPAPAKYRQDKQLQQESLNHHHHHHHHHHDQQQQQQIQVDWIPASLYYTKPDSPNGLYSSLSYLDQELFTPTDSSSLTIMSSKSGSLPSRGFRDTFVSAQSPSRPVPTVVAMDSSEGHKESKKWSFGGLFKRKSKTPSVVSSPTPIPPSALPAHLTRNTKSVASQRVGNLSQQHGSPANPIPKPARVPVELSSELTSSEEETLTVTKGPVKTSFITRLSKKKSKKESVSNGLLKVPPLQNGRRVGSSPDCSSVTAGQQPWSPWGNGWEGTRRSQNSGSNHNYSSSSMEGSLKTSKAAAREAVKARAVARRESFLCSSSSEDDENNGGSSAQGSYSSLSSRNRRKRMSRPELVRGSPAAGMDKPDGYLPPSPRWEARIVYTQESVEQVEPVVLRLPQNKKSNLIYDSEEEESGVIKAGLKVPLVVPTSSPYPPEDRTYANLPNPVQYDHHHHQHHRVQSPQAAYAHLMAAPQPPPRDFKNNFYRPVSCSYLDSYRPQDYDGGYDNLIGLPVQPTVPQHVQLVSSNNNSTAYHHHRSPSEPKVIQRPVMVARPDSNNRQQQQIHQQQQQPVLSKLGFPVRKLADAHKLPATQSPVHMRASEFWRKKEQEQGIISPNPRTFMNRIRSAGNSPVPGVKGNRGSPKFQATASPISNESVSSLSSLSAEAIASRPVKASSSSSAVQRSSRPLTPSGRTIVRPQTLNLASNQPIKTGQSACERLKVKLPSNSNTPTEDHSTVQAIKTSGKNLEEALNELEDMYKSLRLSDEDLLDRAERRDLPTPHQELRNLPFVGSSPPGSVDNLDTASILSTPSSAKGSLGSQTGLQRTRAPPMRRSGRVDTVNDDMAKRRFDSAEVKANDPRDIVGKAGSYMAFSPAFSPPASPTPPDPLFFDEPDLTADDVSYRNYKRANAIRVIEPQPLFGIPLAPGAPAPDSDYLHVTPSNKDFRPLFRSSKRPDLIKDDIAFRNLRKDFGSQEPLSKDWTPKLFPTKSDAQPTTGDLHRPGSNKKLRAIRSLSANISHLIPFKESMVSAEIGKWNSYSDLVDAPFQLSSSNSNRASTYMEPSWVEQIEAVATKETLAATERVVRKMKSPIPSKRRPWTDMLLESFEKEKAEIERLNQEAEDALSKLDEREAGDGQEDVEVYHDAKPHESSTSPADQHHQQYITPKEPQSPEILPNNADDPPKPKKRTTKPTVASSPSVETFESKVTIEVSDSPGEQSENNKPLFTPPRKVHQIQLDSFNVTEEPKTGTTTRLEKKSSEKELNELIDALVRDADSCGGPPSSSPDKTVSPPITTARTSEEDSKKDGGDDSRDSNNLVAPVAATPGESTNNTKDNSALTEKVTGRNGQRFPNGRHGDDDSSDDGDGNSNGMETVKMRNSLSCDETKDKSSKRKSNLNRALTEEPTVSPVLPLSSNGGDDKARRRSSRPVSQDVSTLLTASTSDGDTKAATIIKAPQIPAIFQKSVDNKLIKEPPSNIRRTSTTINDKIKKFQRDEDGNNNLNEIKNKSCSSSPTAASNEGGMSSIKRLLQKESKIPTEPTTRKAEPVRRYETPVPPSSSENASSRFFGVKKSPSAGSTFNMSKVTNSQPSFLRKFFEKPSSSAKQETLVENESKGDDGIIGKTGDEKTEEDPVLGLSVVQKATLFMKLEHDQRFSKWRKEHASESTAPTPGFQTPLESFSKTVDDQSSLHQSSIKSSFPGHDGVFPEQPDPSNLSLKDRVSMFDRSHHSYSRPSSVKPNYRPFESSSFPRQTPIRTPFDPDHRRSVMEEFSTPIGWLPPDPSYIFAYPPNNVLSPLSMAKRRGSISDADLNSLRQMASQQAVHHQQQFHPGFPVPPPPYPFQCLPPPPPFMHGMHHQHHSSPMKTPQVRGYRVKSLFVSSGTSDHEGTHSEDGEVSSGGQEVSEIISKSYENSPVFRKKTWRSQKKGQEKLFSKELWRRCTQVQQLSQEDYNTDTNEVFYDAKSEFEDFEKDKFLPQPPSTSNLLPILTALSSSNDELDDANKPSSKPKITRKMLISSNNNTKTEVTVPRPDDDSFRAFFHTNNSGFPPVYPTSAQNNNKGHPERPPSSEQQQSTTAIIQDLSVVKRESEMLVMKKQVPLVRRKSSGKSKNPLKALAARLDFSNQKYTEVHHINSNNNNNVSS